MNNPTQRLPGRARSCAPLDLAKRYGVLILFVALTVALSAYLPDFLGAGNINKILHAAAISSILFLGVTAVAASGEIDISFMSVAAVSNMLTAWMIVHGYGWATASCVSMAAGVAAGALNGVLVGVWGLPSLITTLAVGGVAQSIAAALGQGASISLDHTGFVGALLNLNVDVLPAIAVVAAALYAGAWYAQERLVVGHYLYAMEQNRDAVAEAGIPVRQGLIVVFIVSGGMAGVAGILLAADLSSGQPRIGLSYFLDGLTAVLLGAMAIRPRQPNVLGTLIGVLTLAVLVNGTALLGWPDWQRQLVKGLILIVGALVLTTRRSSLRAARP